MLRPERMSRVSVTGSKRVMVETIEAIHDLNLVHLVDYDGAWEGFDPGDPLEPADETSERLVTVRSIESILGVDDEDADAGTPTHVTEEDIEEELADVRTEVNALDDRRSDLRDELRAVEERIDAAEPFSDVGIDIDLLSGYDSLAVSVGEGDREAVESALRNADGIDEFEVFAGDSALAIFVHPADEAALDEALVGVEYAAVEIPDAEGAPGAYLAELEEEHARIESELEDVEAEIESLKEDAARFLLAAEERLSIEVQKAEAPLRFATTKNAFLAEGWIPTDRYGELEAALAKTAGDLVEVEELERADYEPGHAHGHDEEAMTDGGSTMGEDRPPVVQDNPEPIKPFQLLTDAVGRPSYSEIDPTVILFLTFPVMFGFMIGDVGYGAIYTAIGLWMYRSYDSVGFKNFGYITAAAGAMTVLFGFLYGEIFGLHLVTEYFWHGVVGLEHAPIEKGLSPATSYWAQAWFVVTALFGVVHLNIGYVFQFVEDRALHGLKDAILDSGSWLLALNGLWLFIFSTAYSSFKPDLLFTVFNEGEGAAFELGFAGLPVWVGQVGGVMILAGLILIALGPTYELIEFHVILGHALSYLRIGAVLLAKAGMAFAVNLLFFGAYNHHGEFHFMLSHGPEYVLEHTPEAEIMFSGMLHGGPASIAFGVVVLLVGHLVVLALGVTSAGIQAIRLEYFEFFSKFYDGAGTPYAPFGHERKYTAEQ